MPGVNVTITNAAAPNATITNTGKLFAIGQCERGSITAPTLVHSYPEFKEACGSAVAGSYLSSGAEEFFAEGGATLYVGRAAASAVSASGELENGAKSKKVAKVSAKNPGEWGNKLVVKIVHESGEKYSVTVLESGVEVEKKTELEGIPALVSFSETSTYITVTETAFNEEPIAEELTLTGGTNGGAVEAVHYEIALSTFNKELGLGQVAAPGVTTAAVQELLLAHAEKNNRIALVDAAKGATLTELKSVSLNLRTKLGARRSALFSTWAVIPGIAPNTTRQVPWSVVQAGMYARNDATATPPPVNEAAAGLNGIPRNVISLQSEFNRAEREELSKSRINAIRNTPGIGLETYDNVTLVNPNLEPAWEGISYARLFTFVIGEGEQIMEKFIFDEIDPHGLLFQKVGGTLQSFLESLGNQLFNPANEAVNVGSSVNTKKTISEGKLNADIAVQPSPTASTANLNITAIPA